MAHAEGGSVLATGFLKEPTTGLGYRKQVSEVPHHPSRQGQLQKVRQWLLRRLAYVVVVGLGRLGFESSGLRCRELCEGSLYACRGA